MKQAAHAGRIPALDGVRAVAIGCVVIEHLVRSGYGWYGVDLFFALSGFLITTILLGERHEPRFWRMFYVRRATRILPPFLFLLVLSTLFGHLEWRVLLPWIALSLSNVALLWHRDAMSAAGLGILWSLSVEEHFYLFWPLQVRRLRRRTLLIVLLAIFAVEPLLRAMWMLHGHSERALYLLTPFHLDAIVLGSLLALGCSHPSARIVLDRWAPSALPVAVLCGLILWHGLGDAVVRGAFQGSLVGVSMSLCVMFVVLRPHSALSRVLAIAPLPWLGRISYGFYLYHELIWFWAMDLRQRGVFPFTHGWFMRLTTVLAATLLAWASFRFIETPLMNWGRRKAKSYREEAFVAHQVC